MSEHYTQIVQYCPSANVSC